MSETSGKRAMAGVLALCVQITISACAGRTTSVGDDGGSSLGDMVRADAVQVDAVQVDAAAAGSANHKCSEAQLLKLDPNGRVSAKGTTFGMPNEYGTAINCGDAATPWSGPQAYYKVRLDAGKTYRIQVSPMVYLPLRHYLHSQIRYYPYFAFLLFRGCGPAAMNKECGSKGLSGDLTVKTKQTLFEPGVSGLYYIAVESRGDDTPFGPFTLDIETYTLPPNRTCSAPLELKVPAGGEVLVQAELLGAKNQFGAGITCGSKSLDLSGPQLYYRVQLTAGRTYRVITSASSEKRLAIFRSGCDVSAINKDCGSKGKTGAWSDDGYAGPTFNFTPSRTGRFTVAVDGTYKYYSHPFKLMIMKI